MAGNPIMAARIVSGGQRAAAMTDYDPNGAMVGSEWQKILLLNSV
jgi:hypothetical protein